MESTVEPASPPTAAALKAALEVLCQRAEADPFSNPIVLFAIDLARRLDRGGLGIEELTGCVRELTQEAFVERAARLRAYLGEVTREHNRASLIATIERLAADREFSEFRRTVERPVFGIVMTAHPTFALPLTVARALAELAAGITGDGAQLDEATRARILAEACAEEHRPPERLSLEVEHQWALEALTNAHEALDELNRAVLTIARDRWPEHWTLLTPRLITLASWVGYDQDGRTDVTSMRSFAVRLADKRAALARSCARVARLGAGSDARFSEALRPLTLALERALTTVDRQIGLLAQAEHDPGKMPQFSRAMVAGRSASLVETDRVLELVDEALGHASADAERFELLLLRAAMVNHGLGLAHIHVRLNASQLHNAIRRAVGLETEPNDPSNRRTYFSRINDLLEIVEPAAINFADVLSEQASARRLMMTVAQIIKYIDAETPIRFLIAETETGFTLLTALYYARLFDVEDRVEISPLFETEEAFERGERVLEEALKSPHYRDYLKSLGRMAVQFGYSDSGRFLGQMAATFNIERLRLRLAQLLERHGLGSVEVILFNTHGESIGRGCHPNSLRDRLQYLAPAPNRAEFANRGIRVKEEISFQGGDGFIPFLSPATAMGVITRILEFAFEEFARADDPIYLAPGYAAEFFASLRQEFTGLVADPDYAALLGLYGTNMLYRTGSRPPARQHEEQGRTNRLEHPAQLRAIPNNAILQQLGFLANTLYGLGGAASKDPEMFAVMRERSPRFRGAMQMVATALEFSELHVMRAYAHIFDPDLWLTNSGRARNPARAKALREMARLTERLAQHDSVARLIRRLEADYLLLRELMPLKDTPRRQRVILLHALKVALIQRIALLATGIPPFSPQQGVTRDDLLAQIVGLDLPGAIEQLARIFPVHENDGASSDDYGEKSSYRAEGATSYALEQRLVFQPMLQLYELVRALGAALNHEIGAIG